MYHLLIMSDSKAFLSYFGDTFKQYAARVAMFVVAAILLFALVKWAFTGGLVSMFGSIFGPSKDTVISDQRAAITQLETAVGTAETTTKILQGSISNIEQTSVDNQAQKVESSNKTSSIIAQGQQSYQNIVKTAKKSTITVAKTTTKKTAPGAADEVQTTMEEVEITELQNPHSKPSMELVDVQFAMMQKAQCLAQGSCSS